MARSSRRIGLLLLAYLGVLGYLLVSWMPTVIERYQRTAEQFPRLGYLYLGAVAIGVAVLLGLSLWILIRLWRNSARKRRDRGRRVCDPSALSPTQQQAELQDNLATSRAYAAEQNVSVPLREEIERGLAELEAKQNRRRLEIVAFGTISSGKSTLLNALAGRDVFAADVVGGTTVGRCEVPWPGKDEVVLVDTPGLAEIHGESRAAASAAAAKNADLVLLVVDGPLKGYEVDLAGALVSMEKRVVVCLNKEDWYEQEDQQELVDQIAEQLPEIAKDDIVTVRAGAARRRQVRVLPDGGEEELFVDIPPDIRPLAVRMLEIVEHDGRDLLLANLLLQSRGLVDDAKGRVRAVLDVRAEEIIRRHMWAAGSATGLNPIPLLDIAGGSAITVKMVLELARTYKQSLDADSAVKLLDGLGKNLIAMIGATAATPAVAGAIGTLLKTVPGIGTLAGGLLQGVVQALVTRWIGNTFVEYFRLEMKPPPSGLAELARQQWDKLTAANAIRQLVLAGKEKLEEKNHE